MVERITTPSLVGLMCLPVIGLFLLTKQQKPRGVWNAVLLLTNVAYILLVAQSSQNLFAGIAVAHISFISTVLWYSVIAGEDGNAEQTNDQASTTDTSIFSAVCIPVVVFQIVASGSRLFGNVSMESCSNIMRSWFIAVILLTSVLLIGRRCYWQELNWFAESFDRRTTETTVSYMILGFIASLIYPFFLSDFPNPIRILLCTFH